MEGVRRLAFCVALLFALAPARARADENDALRHQAEPSSPSSEPSRDSSAGDRDRGHDSGWAAACDAINCLCDLLDTAQNAPPQPVVEEPSPTPAPVPESFPPNPFKALVLVGLEDVLTSRQKDTALVHDTTLVPRAAAQLDLPVGRSMAFRFALEHEAFAEVVPASPGKSASWDSLPLTSVHVGWVLRLSHLELALVGGLRLLWLPAGPVPGVDGGLDALFEDGPFFAAVGATAMAIGGGTDSQMGTSSPGLSGVDPEARLGYAVHHLQLAVGWRALAFFLDPARVYTGPELSVALRF